MDVKDGVAEASLPKRVGKTAQSDMRIVVNTCDDFVPQSDGCINDLECVFIEVHWGIRGGRAGDTGCSKVSKVLEPNRAALVG